GRSSARSLPAPALGLSGICPTHRLARASRTPPRAYIPQETSHDASRRVERTAGIQRNPIRLVLLAAWLREPGCHRAHLEESPGPPTSRRAPPGQPPAISKKSERVAPYRSGAEPVAPGKAACGSARPSARVFHARVRLPTAAPSFFDLRPSARMPFPCCARF